MARDWFDDYGEPENRSAAVDRHMARLKLSPDAPASPAELERKRQREAETLARRDRMFGLDGGLAESLRRVARPHYGVGDSEGRDD